MVEVAIKAVEEVFDWEAFLKEYYAHSPNPEADMLASEAKLAMDGELIHKAKNTRKIDAKKIAHETAMAETIRAVEIKSVSTDNEAAGIVTGEIQAEPDIALSLEDEEYPAAAQKEQEADESENLSVEEVEAGFKIEEPEATENINADDVPLFKQRDRD